MSLRTHRETLVFATTCVLPSVLPMIVHVGHVFLLTCVCSCAVRFMCLWGMFALGLVVVQLDLFARGARHWRACML